MPFDGPASTACPLPDRRRHPSTRSRRVRLTAASAGLALVVTGVSWAGPLHGAPLGSGPRPALAQTAPTSTSDGITVVGVGTVSGTPDTLRMSLRVVVVRPDVDRALRDANVVLGRIRSALSANGVKAEDLRTTALNVGPSYGGKPSRLIGYQVVQGLAVQLRNLDTAGKTIGDAIGAGTTYLRFDGVSFALTDDSPLKKTARDKAFAQARDKAEQYASLSGRRLVAVESISEDVTPQYGDYGSFAYGSAASASAPSVGLDPGTQQVDVRVVVRWSLG